MSEILTKFEEEMAALRKEWTEFYGQFINKEETKDTLEVINGIYRNQRVSCQKT